MQSVVVGNPFALMMEPEAVIQAVERSERLRSLRRRIHRPLDKPLMSQPGDQDDPSVEEFEPVLIREDEIQRY